MGIIMEKNLTLANEPLQDLEKSKKLTRMESVLGLLMIRFRNCYMGKFNLSKDLESDWKLFWAKKLDGFSPRQIIGAMDVVDKYHDWPPTPEQFIKIIQPESQLDYEGMFKNAANAISTKQWPDALTYHAACAFGIFEMRNSDCNNHDLKRWKEIVDRLKDQDLELPTYNEDQLPAPGQIDNPEVALTHLQKIKRVLNIT